MFIKQNKSLHTNYIYKTKYKTESLQNKTKIHIQVMFTKLNTKQKVYETKQKFYKHVMFTKLGLDTEKCWG